MSATTKHEPRTVIGAILDGQNPNGATPADLGAFGELYGEMCRAWQTGGTQAARTVFASYAAHDRAVAELRSGAASTARQTEWTAQQLYDAVFPPPVFAVDGLIPEGLTLLIARPKIGKSWMALQLGVAVGTGGHALGQTVKQGKALYLALEDSPLRMQSRMFKMQRAPRATDMTIVHTWRPLSEDAALTELMTKIEEGGYTLVIVDTLQRAVGGASVVKDAARLSKILGTLQQFALQNHIALVIVHHSRKSATDIATGGGDVIDDAMGGTEIAGVTDAVIGIYRKRGDSAATMRVTGRDIEEKELAVEFDKKLFCWQVVGEAGSVKADTLQAAILETIKEFGGLATVTQVAKFLEKDKSNVRKELLELVDKGALTKAEKSATALFA